MLRITFTGADESTRINHLLRLAELPGVEIGLLYSATPEGRNRYPCMEYLLEAAGALKDRCAIHVCGMRARAELIAGALHPLVSQVGRVQLNGIVSPEVAALAAAQVSILITQHTQANEALARLDLARHAILVDDSGGRGVSPLFWQAPDAIEGKAFGFAGGLGPENLAAEIPRIVEAAGDRLSTCWMDMEGRLRSSMDQFDVWKALRCRDIYEKLVSRGVAG